MKHINTILFPAKSSPPALIAVFLMAVAVEAAMAPPGGCTKTLMAMSPCLPYISSPPNNFSSSTSSQCCDTFSSAFDRGDAACLCFLLRQPLLLGFPLNTTRILSLTPLCPPKNVTSTTRASLESICKGSPTLPPLTGPSESENSESPPIPQPESEASSPTPTSPSPELGKDSLTLSIDNSSCQFLPGIMLFIVHIFAYL